MSKKKDSASRFDALFGAAKPKEQTPAPDEVKPAKKSKSTDPDYVRTTVYLPKRLHKQLKAAAADEEREMSEILEGLVEQWLKERAPSDA
ncbi:MAG TPA: ribbon-helix-helix protein, CopG family [Allocoleopsis sp.]